MNILTRNESDTYNVVFVISVVLILTLGNAGNIIMVWTSVWVKVIQLIKSQIHVQSTDNCEGQLHFDNLEQHDLILVCCFFVTCLYTSKYIDVVKLGNNKLNMICLIDWL